MTEQTDAAEVELTEAEKDALWEAIERAFLDTSTYSKAAEDNVERIVARMIAAAEGRGAQAVLAAVEVIHSPFTTPDGVTLCSGCPDPWPCDSLAAARAAAAAAGGGGEA